ncbi:MAG: hypothetical protein JXA03_10500 [Bacteroidales bacterium]|nr:hypothetical protein [Bacteroidales bacterium]
MRKRRYITHISGSRVTSMTIIELVVAMAISSFVVMMAVLVYLAVDNRFNVYRQVTNATEQMFELAFILRYDIDKAQIIVLGSDLGLYDDTGKKQKEYSWYREGLVRIENDRRDTFHLSSLSVTCMLLGQQVSEGLVDEIALSFFDNIIRDTVDLRISKAYSSETIIYYIPYENEHKQWN